MDMKGDSVKDLWYLWYKVLAKQTSFFLQKMKELKNVTSVATNRQQEIVLKITLIELMQEIRFNVIIVRKLLQRRVIQLISSATNAHSSDYLDTWMQGAPMWAVSLHAYLESIHEQAY